MKRLLFILLILLWAVPASAQFSLQALHDEIENDPESVGYKTGEVWKGDQAIADSLNSLVSPGAESITRLFVAREEILFCIDAGEVDTDFTEDERWLISSYLNDGPIIDATEAPVFSAINTIFSNADMPNTRACVLGKVQRTGSRAEVLWGENTTITPGQVGAAANL